MVPLADIFNHKAAIVQLSDDYAIEPTCYEGSDYGSYGDIPLQVCGTSNTSSCLPFQCLENVLDVSLLATEEEGTSSESGSDCEDDSENGECQPSLPAADQHGLLQSAARITRGALLQASGADPEKYRLEIGICGATREDGQDILQVMSH